jgi:hypothetical protein
MLQSSLLVWRPRCFPALANGVALLLRRSNLKEQQGVSAGAHDEQKKQGERPGKTQQAARPVSSKRLLNETAQAR